MRQLPRRELRGLGLMAQGAQVRRVTDALFIVNSSSGLGSYEVAWAGCRWTCQCEDFARTGGPCKHVHALHWGLVLPVVLLGNSAVTAGPDEHEIGPTLIYHGRTAPVGDVVQVYRAALERLKGVEGIRLIKPPPPRMTRQRFASVPA